MVSLSQLWLPILVSAVILFIASAIIWMVLPIHKKDYKNPGEHESTLLDMFRRVKLAPGMYFIPWCHGQDMKDPANQQKMKDGPWVMMTVHGEMPNMGKMLGLWFVHLLIIGFAVACVAMHSRLAPGASYWEVFQVVGIVGLIAHCGYALPMAIWHGMPWSQLPGRVFDGIVYAALTGGTFAGFWPGAITPA